MGELLLVEQDTLDGPAGAVFSAIEAGAVPGWELTDGARLAVGVPVRMPVTLPSSLGGRRVELLGRVATLVPGRRLVVEYHLPWHGSVMLSASPLGPDQCRVRMSVQVDDSALDWLDRARGGLGGARSEDAIMAWVVPRDGAALDADAVRAFCQGKIAHYKVPHYVHVTTQFPTTITGKVQKFVMREQAIELLGLQADAAVSTA